MSAGSISANRPPNRTNRNPFRFTARPWLSAGAVSNCRHLPDRPAAVAEERACRIETLNSSRSLVDGACHHFVTCRDVRHFDDPELPYFPRIYAGRLWRSVCNPEGENTHGDDDNDFHRRPKHSTDRAPRRHVVPPNARHNHVADSRSLSMCDLPAAVSRRMERSSDCAAPSEDPGAPPSPAYSEQSTLASGRLPNPHANAAGPNAGYAASFSTEYPAIARDTAPPSRSRTHIQRWFDRSRTCRCLPR